MHTRHFPRHMGYTLCIVTGALLAVGGGLLAGTQPKTAFAIAAFSGALLAGYLIASVNKTPALLAALTLVVVVAPRVVERMYPEPRLDTGNGQFIAILAFATIGAAVPVAEKGIERTLVLFPAVMMIVGAILLPGFVKDPSFGWLAATGALFVLGRRWRPKGGGAILLAFLLGAVSIYLVIPGFRAVTAIYPSNERSYGFFGNPIISADAIMFMAAALIAICWQRGIAVLAISVVAITAVIETGSRTGIMLAGFLLLVTLVGWFPRLKQIHRTPGRFFTILIIAGAGMAFFIFNSDVLGRAGALSGQETSFTARIAAIGAGMIGSVSNPAGGDNISVVYSAGILPTYENLFFDVGARLGWFPLVGTVVAFVLCLRIANRAGRVAVFSVILAGATAGIYYHPAAFILGILCAGVVDGAAQRHADQAGTDAAIPNGREIRVRHPRVMTHPHLR